MVFAASPWSLVFSHDTSGGLFTTDADALSKNKDDTDAKLFSILDTLETFRLTSGLFHLRLCYPEISGRCNEWSQTSNLATDSTITGFQAVNLEFPQRGGGGTFQGLGVKTVNKMSTVINDHPESTQWWNAIGAKKYFGDSDDIPGPPGTKVKKVEIYVKRN